MNRHQLRTSAFTLVEMLLTISLVALILIEAGAVFRTASRAYRTNRRGGERGAQIDAGMRLIAFDIERLECPLDRDRPVVTVSMIDGGPAVLLRLRTTAAATADGAPAVIDYFVVPDANDAAVLARRRQIIDERPDPLVAGAAVDAVAWEIVAEKVERFAVRCFDGVQWSDTGLRGTPKLIEVSLAIERSGSDPAVYERCFEVLATEPFGPEAGRVQP